MAMHDIREEIQCPKHFQHRFLIECEPFAVIRIAVKSISFKIAGMFDKIIGDIFPLRLINGRDRVDYTDMNRDCFQLGELTAVFFSNSFIQRQNNSGIHAFFIQDFRQRADNVCQSAGFDIRQTFRCDKQY